MTVAALWSAGELRAAVERSASELADAAGHPFRDAAVLGDDLDTARRLFEHGSRCWFVARFAECERALERAYAIRSTRLGARHVDTLATVERMAALDHYLDRGERARQRWELVLDDLDSLDEVRGAIAHRNFAAFLRIERDFAGATRHLAAARRVLFRELPDDDPELLALRKVEAFLAYGERRHRAALDIVEEAIAAGAHDDDHPHVAAAKLIAARALADTNNRPVAARLLDDVLESFARGYGDHPLHALALSLGAFVVDDRVLALDRARAAYAMYRKTYPPPNRSLRGLADRLCDYLGRAGLHDEVAAIRTENATR